MVDSLISYYMFRLTYDVTIVGLVQDYSNSIANALELLQSGTKST